jgi:probable nitrogen fixation protein
MTSSPLPVSDPVAAGAPTDDPEAVALASPFVRALVRQLRAHDTSGAWDGKADAEVLAGYIVTREMRRSMPLIADPDAKTLWRIEQFYNALGLRIEQSTGLIATPLLKLTHEGFGRVVLIAGRLVVTSKIIRDAHRFGFETMEKLAAEGEKLAVEAARAIEQYPEVARL